MKLSIFFEALIFSSAIIVADGASQSLDSNKDLPKLIYVHVGVSGNFFILSSDDISQAIDPFKLSAVNFGYAYYVTAGIRNIAQIEYRKGKDNNAFFHDAGFTRGGKIDRTSITMKFEHSQRIFKFNPLFFVKKLRAWSLFILWGHGKVDFVDKAKNGLADGSKSIRGVEVSLITRYAQVGGSLEKHSMTFDRFVLDGFPSLIQSLDANYWQFNLRLAIGLGI